MTVGELIEILEEYEPETNVKIAYQPNWPLSTDVSFVKKANGTDYYRREIESVYLCQSASGGGEYAPGSIYRDDDDEEDE